MVRCERVVVFIDVFRSGEEIDGEIVVSVLKTSVFLLRKRNCFFSKFLFNYL